MLQAQEVNAGVREPGRRRPPAPPSPRGPLSPRGPHLAVAAVEVALSAERPVEGLHRREQLLLQRLQRPHPGLPDRGPPCGERLLQGVDDVL